MQCDFTSSHVRSTARIKSGEDLVTDKKVLLQGLYFVLKEPGLYFVLKEHRLVFLTYKTHNIARVHGNFVNTEQNICSHCHQGDTLNRPRTPQALHSSPCLGFSISQARLCYCSQWLFVNSMMMASSAERTIAYSSFRPDCHLVNKQIIMPKSSDPT